MQDETTRDEKKTQNKRTSQLTLKDYVRIILIKKWVVLLILSLFLGASIYYIKTSPPVYESRILLMRETTSERLPASIIGLSFTSLPERWDEGQELLLKSGIVLAEIKRQLSEKYDSEVTVEQLGERISISPYKGSSKVLGLIATANTAEQAQALANAAADAYINRATEIKTDELNQGLEFLGQQMDQLEDKMQDVERSLNDFRDKEGLIFTTSEATTSGLLGRLGELQGELLQAENDIELVKSQLQSVAELISEKRKQVRSSSVDELSPQIDQIRERLISLQMELNTKLETFTEKDPEVVALRKTIDAMQKQLKSEFNALLEGSGAASFDPVSELQSLMQQHITLNVQLKGLERKAALVAERLDEFKAQHPELISKQIELVRLERRSRIYEQTYTALTSKYEDMRLLERMKSSGLKVIDTASLPNHPIAPKKKQALAIGVLFGLSLGIMVAFFLELLDDSIKRKEDVERFLELPVMGTVPKIEPFDLPKDTLSWRGDGNPGDGSASRRRSEHGRRHRKRMRRMLSSSLLYAPNGSVKSPVVESYRNLAASIRYANIDNPIKSLLVTSSTPGEGKTITASNLAIVMAQSGMKVLLIDADLRRPSMHRIFQQDRAPGLTDILTSDNGSENGLSDLVPRDVIRPTMVENLYLLPCGVQVPNPGVLFPSERMHNLVENLVQQHDLIIFDSPPLGAVADPINLSTEVDGTLMVIYSGKTKRNIGIQGKASLESVNAEVIGTVLNNVDYAKQYGYYYYHYYYYYKHYGYYSRGEDG